MRVLIYFILPMTLLCQLHTHAQNISINILTQNGGVVKTGDTVSLEITILNTDPADTLSAYKIRPQISIPGAFVKVAEKGHQLPAGWAITQVETGVIRLTNGTDRIQPNNGRLIVIKLIGKRPGEAQKIAANLMFSNGEYPGTVPGTSTKGDTPADNISSTTCEVHI